MLKKERDVTLVIIANSLKRGGFGELPPAHWSSSFHDVGQEWNPWNCSMAVFLRYFQVYSNTQAPKLQGILHIDVQQWIQHDPTAI